MSCRRLGCESRVVEPTENSYENWGKCKSCSEVPTRRFFSWIKVELELELESGYSQFVGSPASPTGASRGKLLPAPKCVSCALSRYLQVSADVRRDCFCSLTDTLREGHGQILSSKLAGVVFHTLDKRSLFWKEFLLAFSDHPLLPQSHLLLLKGRTFQILISFWVW